MTTLHMSHYHGSPSDHISRWHFVEHFPTILNAPTFCIDVLPTKTSNSQPIWMSSLWTSLPSSSVHKLTHTLITYTKVNLLRHTPSLYNCWKSCITFSSCPSLTYFVNFWFHTKMFNYIMPGVIADIFVTTHGGFCWSPSQSPFMSSYVWNLGTFHLSTTKSS